MVKIKDNMKLVPKLRFPGFDTPWKLTKLGNDVIKVGSGSTPKGGAAVYQNEGVLFIRSQNVNENRLLLENVTFISQDIHKQMKNSEVHASDILLNITGASIGRSCVVPDDFTIGNVNQHVCIIRLKKQLSPKFYQTFMSSAKGQKLVYQGQAGGGREGLNFQSIRLFKISSPTLPEQKKIASFLSAVDKKIEQLTTKKQLLEQYKKGVMQKIFSQQIRFKDDNGKNYPDWQEKRLGDVASFTKGKGISKADVSFDGKIECIRYGELYTVYAEIISTIQSKTSVDSSELVLSKVNDVIIPSSGETHIDLATASCVVKKGVALGGDINIIRTKQNGIFLAYYLNNAKQHDIARLAQGKSVVHLYSSHLKSLKLSLPNIQEQDKIVSFISGIDKKIESIQSQLTETQKFKKGLLQQLFV